jgi:hypothetical protein
MRTHVVTGLIAVLVVVSAGGVPLVAATPADSTTPANKPVVASTELATATASTQSTDDEIRMTTTLDRTPDRTGEITATVSFRFPDRVSELTARLPEAANVTATDGFSRDTDTAYEWDERTDRPSVTFRIGANKLVDGSGPLAEEGRFLFADTADWSLVQIPSTGARWLQTGSSELAVVRETAVDGPGAVGDRMAFLGPHEIKTHTAHGQTFRLVVPEAADLEESPTDIFDSLSHASDLLRVGDRDSEVLVIAAPTDSVGWGVRGLQTGESDMWVQDSEPLDDATNVWLHEYVHTRQAYQQQVTAETQWLAEGGASYYAALLTLEQGRIDFDRFQRVLDEGTVEPQSTSILSQPDSWENNANYWKGSLVVGDLDRRIRLATGSEASFETVFRSLNSHGTSADGTITASDLERYVREAGGDDVAADSTRYMTTDAAPAMWDVETHGEAFGQRPARFSFRLAEDDPVRISGPDGTEPLVDTSRTLTVDETLTVDMVARNVGGTVGSYELTFRVNESQTTAAGRLAPNETATHRFNHTFTEPGQYTVTVGDKQWDLRVEEPETASDALPVDVETPGFGVVPAVSALLLGGLLARRR